jgi:hypothetical protein
MWPEPRPKPFDAGRLLLRRVATVYRIRSGAAFRTTIPVDPDRQ